MYWKLTVDSELELEGFLPQDRYALHRDNAELGGMDRLVLHEGNVVRGWRLDGVLGDETAWASELNPCSVQDSRGGLDVSPIESGGYAWEHVGSDGGTLLLERNGSVHRVRVERISELEISDVRATAEVVQAGDVSSCDMAGLVEDGLQARRHAVERLCGLGRELDAERFNDAVWRRTLSGLRLTDIHEQLRAFEVRFDEKYPPVSVSRPESLDDSASEARDERAMVILRGGVA